MRSRLKGLLGPPVDEDNAGNINVTRLLYNLVLVMLACTTIYTLAWPVMAPKDLPRLVLVVPFFTLFLSILWLIHRRSIQLASFLLVAGCWFTLSLSAALSGGVKAPAFSGLLVVVLIAGLLLGRRLALLVSGASILAGAGMVFAQSRSWIGQDNAYITPLVILVSQAVFFSTATALLHFATHSINDTLHQTQRTLNERRQAEQMLRRYAERLQALHEIDQAILAAQSPAATAMAALNRIHQLITCQHASVALFDLDQDEMVILAALTENPTSIPSGQVLPLKDFGPLNNLQAGKQLVVTDLLDEPHPAPLDQRLLSEGVRSYLSVPLWIKGELLGSLNLGAERPGAFGEEESEITRELADVLAVAIQQARLHEQAQERAEDLEKRVQERTAQLEAANKELESFSYSVSHDLKAPLRSIDSYSRFLLDDYGSNLEEEGQQFLHAIRKAVDRMRLLIDDLLQYSRLERTRFSHGKLNLPELVQAILVERSEELRGRDIEVVINISCNQVYADPQGLSQVMRNLVDNALKFTQDVPKPHIEIGGQETASSFLLSVRDNGIGFDMQYHERIFEIFQRLHHPEDFPGTGIGLAIVRRAVQRMGGRVWAESRPGGGAIFFVEIPKEAGSEVPE